MNLPFPFNLNMWFDETRIHYLPTQRPPQP
jgi:hypothetical protein